MNTAMGKPTTDSIATNSSLAANLRVKIVTLLEERRFEDALRILRMTLRRSPSDESIARSIQLLECKLSSPNGTKSFAQSYDQAVAAHLEGDYNAALRHFGCCQVLDPENTKIAHNITLLRQRLGTNSD